MDAMAHEGKIESICIHICDTLGAGWVGGGPLRSVSGGLLFGWLGPRADTEKWQHLAPLRVILFSVGVIYRQKEVCGSKVICPVCFLFLHSCWTSTCRLFFLVAYSFMEYGV